MSRPLTGRPPKKQTGKQVVAGTERTGRQIESNQRDTGGILMRRSTDVSDMIDN